MHLGQQIILIATAGLLSGANALHAVDQSVGCKLRHAIQLRADFRVQMLFDLALEKRMFRAFGQMKHLCRHVVVAVDMAIALMAMALAMRLGMLMSFHHRASPFRSAQRKAAAV
ncbi:MULTISPECIES: hypothetical protein [unclassified Novosphingobium]|uniref:hypothetical protein n=1 Tax=unclassified Novosphingobium TaxID=2644732 RepID=UPI001AC25E86|nr:MULTISPECIES: hypothetical protein [unclassified Novosphingobium]MBN9143680.1 hypothetical protein [Novosphingobium sp.]MDR6706937.1 hypothetical protein [Novosphingobium sp. 1748]